MILLLYVDDLFLTSEYEIITDAKRRFATKFKIKYLGMVHYFLGMEAWQSADGIFLGQGKYAVEIMKIFKMMEYNTMATPIESNLKLLSDDSSEKIDATMYHHMIGPLMYMKNMIPNICFTVNTLN